MKTTTATAEYSVGNTIDDALNQLTTAVIKFYFTNLSMCSLKVNCHNQGVVENQYSTDLWPHDGSRLLLATQRHSLDGTKGCKCLVMHGVYINISHMAVFSEPSRYVPRRTNTGKTYIQTRYRLFFKAGQRRRTLHAGHFSQCEMGGHSAFFFTFLLPVHVAPSTVCKCV